MAHDLGTYQNSDIRQQTIDLLNNLGGGSVLSPGVSIVGSENTPTLETKTAELGNITGPFKFASVTNAGENDGTLMGDLIPAGETINLPVILNDWYGDIPYDCTDTIFKILKVVKTV